VFSSLVTYAKQTSPISKIGKILSHTTPLPGLTWRLFDNNLVPVVPGCPPPLAGQPVGRSI